MKQKLNRLYHIFSYDALAADPSGSKQGLLLLCGGIALVAAVMSVLNFRISAYVIALATLFFAAFGIVCFLILLRFDCVSQISTALSVMMCVIFSYFFISGANEGFAALWVLLAPLLFIELGGSKQSIYCGLYFLLLTIAICWTPLRYHIPGGYYTEFFKRFPVLYLFFFAVSSLINYEVQSYRIRQASHMDELQKAVEDEKLRNQNMYLQMIVTMSSVLDAKDPYTNAHSFRVAEYARKIATKLGYSVEDQILIYQAGLVHDIGKIGIPDSTLNFPGRLTDEQYAVIKTHPEIGKSILSKCIEGESILDGVMYHHERYDGRGYPAGLSGDNIPRVARILCVADSFDAMASTRVYRKGCDHSYILSELEKGSGTQFDPEVVEKFLEVLSDEGWNVA